MPFPKSIAIRTPGIETGAAIGRLGIVSLENYMFCTVKPESDALNQFAKHKQK